MKRLPKGYRGVNHETIGSDLAGIINTLKMPEIVLGKELASRARTIKPEGWYPIAYLTEVMDKLRSMQGSLAMRQMGRNLFAASHAEFVRANVPSVRKLLESWDGIYHRANRGTDIGGWKLVSFDASRAILDNNTIHDCMLEEGLILGAIEAVGARAIVKQVSCFQQGDEVCRFEITPLNAQKWDG